MGWTTPATWAVGQLDTAALMNATRDNLNQLGSPPRARAYTTTAQSIPNSTATAVLFITNTYDTVGMHSTTSNTSRFYVQQSGLYAVSAAVTFAANSTGARTLSFYKTGNQVDGAVPAQTSGGTYSTSLTLSDEIQCIATDYIEAWVSQTSGAALNINSGYVAYMTVRWVAAS